METSEPTPNWRHPWGVNEYGWKNEQKTEEEQTSCDTALVPRLLADHGTLQRHFHLL
jgi:hypothetical protein